MFTARRWNRQLANRERWLWSEGDANRALDGAEKKVMAEYYILHLAHATIEPPSATARIVDGKAEISTSVQSF
jgi:isoquinoline 1-oxidoreductase beta subunit